MFKEVEVLIGGNLVKTTHYRLFIQQLIQAGIKGNTPAKKLVLDFMSKQEARETVAVAKREQDGGASWAIWSAPRCPILCIRSTASWKARDFTRS